MTSKSYISTTMPGRRTAEGPGGRDCPCCGEAPGKARTIQRRRSKRAQKQSLTRALKTKPIDEI